MEAIKYLMKEEEMNREELHTMRAGLISDGWMSSPYLPQVSSSFILNWDCSLKVRGFEWYLCIGLLSELRYL